MLFRSSVQANSHWRYLQQSMPTTGSLYAVDHPSIDKNTFLIQSQFRSGEYIAVSYTCQCENTIPKLKRKKRGYHSEKKSTFPNCEFRAKISPHSILFLFFPPWTTTRKKKKNSETCVVDVCHYLSTVVGFGILLFN